MVRSRQKVLFEGLAKLRVTADEQGGIQLSAEVRGPGAETLKRAIGELVGDLANADGAALTQMAHEMKGP